jgi:DNA-binding PadR family transcriptional regulator
MSVRHAILGVLTRAPSMHGYHIASELERRIGGGRYNSAQIYQSLHWLAEHGLVVSTPPEPGVSRDRRPFSITSDGRREFDRWLHAPVIISRPARDDAVVKLVFLGLHDTPSLVSFLERLRRQHLRRLAGSRRAIEGPAEVVNESLMSELSGAALRFREEADLRWIDHCLLRLRPLLQADGKGTAQEEPVATPVAGEARDPSRRSRP